jgi:hypothetical protein
MKRVRPGSVYVYNPCGWDIFDPRTGLEPGTMVRVVNLSGCPRANVMGHCHVADPETGRFIGLVCAASLNTVEEYRSYLQRKIAEHETASLHRKEQ